MQKQRTVGCSALKHKHTPHLPDQAVLPKSKDFFMPGESVWNNPYRSSTRLYKYYHAVNDFYEKYDGASLKRREQSDKENAEKLRITKLIQFRNQMRQTFKQRQESRKMLEFCSKGEILTKLELVTEANCCEKPAINRSQSEQAFSNKILNLYRPKLMEKNQNEATVSLQLQKSDSITDFKRNFRSKIVKSTQNLKMTHKK